MPLEVLTSFIKLIEEDPNSVYLSCVGDTLYTHDLAKRPSLNDATKACKDIKLSTLEKHYTEMKNKINERLKSLQAKLKKGQPITSEEEEWMDGDGNLVNTELLMEKISSLATNKKTMNLGSIEVLDWHHQNGKNQSKTAAHFDKTYPNLKIKQPLISKWLKDEASIRSKNIESNNPSTKRLRAVSYPQVEEALNKWMKQAMHLNLTVTGEVIKEKWRDFAWLAGIPSEEWLSLSSGWLDSYKMRHQIKSYLKHGEGASVDLVVLEEEVERIKKITSKFELKNIFNMDKTGLFFSMPPDTGLAFTRTHGIKGNKNQITVALTCNADRSEMKNPLFIGKSKQPRCFLKKDAAFYNYEYANNASAWMTTKIFQHWLKSWNSKLKQENRNILLLLDNFSGHQVPEEGVSNIQVEFFAPNLTSHVQPLDAGIIKCFKSYYRKKAISRTISLFSEEAATGDPKTQAKDLFNVNQLTAMKMAKKAWESVSQQTVSNCWGATKICTQIASRGCSERIQTTINQDEVFLSSQLDCLRVNRMLIQSLLNPEGENDLATTVHTEEEIFNMVKAQENEDQVDDDDDENEPEHPIVRPTKKQMVNHISQTLMYLDGEDNPESNALSNLPEKYQQKLVIDVHFNGQQTTLTNFFKPYSPPIFHRYLPITPSFLPTPSIPRIVTPEENQDLINHYLTVVKQQQADNPPPPPFIDPLLSNERLDDIVKNFLLEKEKRLDQQIFFNQSLREYQADKKMFATEKRKLPTQFVQHLTKELHTKPGPTLHLVELNTPLFKKKFDTLKQVIKGQQKLGKEHKAVYEACVYLDKYYLALIGAQEVEAQATQKGDWTVIPTNKVLKYSEYPPPKEKLHPIALLITGNIHLDKPDLIPLFPSNLLLDNQVQELLEEAVPMTHWTSLSRKLVLAVVVVTNASPTPYLLGVDWMMIRQPEVALFEIARNALASLLPMVHSFTVCWRTGWVHWNERISQVEHQELNELKDALVEAREETAAKIQKTVDEQRLNQALCKPHARARARAVLAEERADRAERRLQEANQQVRQWRATVASSEEFANAHLS
ncbi:hypothetical protein PSHT_01402 [Puccinia striiformis]|uniref:HTH CENPB-type domain-containing protein n=1 Tax=Puccinia striiformis TaxID=27350 RepID=A0A2S4WKM4_9BASI|nr:hypothetical protein PSHT_01402 [Puccinia striiformis]